MIHDSTAEAAYLQLRQVLGSLADSGGPSQPLRSILSRWAQHPLPLPDDLRALWQRAYRHAAPGSREQRGLLRLLAEAGDAGSLGLWRRHICAQPPASPEWAAELFAPLFRHRPAALGTLFPELLEGLAFPALAPLVMDLSNFLARQGLAASHPAADRHGSIARLLGDLADRLELVEQQIRQQREDAQAARQIAESVALAVGCCDALGLIGEPSAAGALHKALRVRHRRVQAEAASALARLGDEAGRQALVDLARDPVIRTRALAYAEELGMSEAIPAELRSEESQAQGRLVAYLAEPFQWGAPPADTGLVQRRRLRWPGYEDPIDCFLWRYTYRQPPREYTNLALVGPGVHAPRADLTGLPPGDVYGLVAGQQAEHPQLRQTPAKRLDDQQRQQALQLVRAAHDEGYTEVAVELAGELFGLHYVLANAQRDQLTGILIVDDRQAHWFPNAPPYTELDAQQRHAIYLGREILKALNRDPDGA